MFRQKYFPAFLLKVASLILVSCLCSSPVIAKGVQEIKLIALFKDKAMIKVNGKQVLLHKNKKNKFNILLLSANSDRAVIRVDGKEITYKLNMLISTNYSKRKHAEVTIWANEQNMFTRRGKINGKSVNFLVDTGATSIAMSESQARSLGINYKAGKKSFAQTASQVVKTWVIKLDSVNLGDIKLRNIPAIVIQGNQSSYILLGMTFLTQVNMTRSGKKMHLVKKY